MAANVPRVVNDFFRHKTLVSDTDHISNKNCQILLLINIGSVRQSSTNLFKSWEDEFSDKASGFVQPFQSVKATTMRHDERRCIIIMS